MDIDEYIVRFQNAQLSAVNEAVLQNMLPRNERNCWAIIDFLEEQSQEIDEW